MCVCTNTPHKNFLINWSSLSNRRDIRMSCFISIKLCVMTPVPLVLIALQVGCTVWSLYQQKSNSQ